MTQPPPLDYQPPPERKGGVAAFVVGILVGAVCAGGAVPLTLLIAFAAGNGGRNPGGELLGLIPGAALITATVVLCVARRTQRFGLGMLAGLPLGILTLVAICGGLV